MDPRKGQKIMLVGPWAGLQKGMVGNYGGEACFNDTFGCVPPLNASIARVAKLGNDSTPEILQFNPCLDGIPCQNLSTDILHQMERAAQEQAVDVVVLALGSTVKQSHETMDKSGITLPGNQAGIVEVARSLLKPIVAVVITGEALSLEGAHLTPVPPAGQAGGL